MVGVRTLAAPECVYTRHGLGRVHACAPCVPRPRCIFAATSTLIIARSLYPLSSPVALSPPPWSGPLLHDLVSSPMIRAPLPGLVPSPTIWSPPPRSGPLPHDFPDARHELLVKYVSIGTTSIECTPPTYIPLFVSLPISSATWFPASDRVHALLDRWVEAPGVVGTFTRGEYCNVSFC
ncbi:hypothetical protein BD626DRAFT_185501 [Schizophyllum amplum]|uniref:Uncharacterized protein n=1 Tax=Schizophyllum amplum TaxID=97359 RepID=A0A550C118_9AGAR|nr:hypothetical protein BD626DRAFT_185501 [Auriculariopsis ampla]